MLDEEIDTITLQISENQALFTFDETLFYTRLLEGLYPDTSRLIPKESTTAHYLFNVSDFGRIPRNDRFLCSRIDG